MRTWSLGDKLYDDKMICPWGMHNFLGNLVSQKTCYNSFSALPEDVVTHFENTKESFDKARISIVSYQNDGVKRVWKVLFCCSLCVKNHVPVYMEKHIDKLPQNQKMEDLMTHLNKLVTLDKSISDVQDLYVSVLPNCPHVKTGLNNSRYIKQPCDHASI